MRVFFGRLLPYALVFTSSLCIMVLELVSSRLVAPHVGSSLTVWTSVIGIILGGICLGNVLGGRLADRTRPRQAIGPLFAFGALLALGALWMNGAVASILPRPDQMNWELRTVLVVATVFLVPATVLGMVGPVVAKMAVEQAERAGSALGDVYFWGAIGSIIGTFLCGFILMYLAATSTIVILVAAALALVAAALMGGPAAWSLGALTAALLVLGVLEPVQRRTGLGSLDLGSYHVHYLAIAGNAAAGLLAVLGLVGLFRSRKTGDEDGDAPAEATFVPLVQDPKNCPPRPGLKDLAVLSFTASLVFMALEMVAGRMVTRQLGSSLYGWTSIIAVLLAGLSFGNFLGGKIADYIKDEKGASWLFLAASVLILGVLVLESLPPWLVNALPKGTQDHFLGGIGGGNSLLRTAQLPEALGGAELGLAWPYRVLSVVAMVFLLPALALGTVSPVVAKLAVDRLKRYQRTGTAIGEVYAWGMVGSILGTFLTGFYFIDFFGTKGVVLLLATIMAFGATMLGTVWHAVWAGVPLGLCVLAFMPLNWMDTVNHYAAWFPSGKSFENIGLRWGIREDRGDPNDLKSGTAWIDESKYYYIKIENELMGSENPVVRRKLVLDNLIHGYFILGHPERLDYDYEHLYALVGYRAVKDTGKVKFKPPGPQNNADAKAPNADAKAPNADAKAPNSDAKAGPSAEKSQSGLKSIAPSAAGGGPAAPPQDKKETAPPQDNRETAPPQDNRETAPAPSEKKTAATSGEKKTAPDAASSSPPSAGGVSRSSLETDALEKKISQEVEDELAKLKGMVFAADDDEVETPYIPPVESSTLKTLFLGGGAYCFQRHMQFIYPGTAVDVAEIDPAVTRANFRATGLPRNTSIKTYWGDARQFVELNQDVKKYDLVFGDAFNDFSVPWHLTTREFNEKIKKMLTPTGVYMINIIDAFETDAHALSEADAEIALHEVAGKSAQERVRAKHLARAHRYGGFLGAWTRTARLTFPHVYIFGTFTPGIGERETFVVVASMLELDLKELGEREDDPRYFTPRHTKTTAEPYGPDLEKIVVEERSRGIVLTDDYAPVENLLAPVAETRGKAD